VVYNTNMAGRPTKITKTRLGKLREAFLWGCTDKEACFYADIHPDTLYEYQKKNPEYSEEKESFKSNPVLVARKTVVDSLKDNPQLALRYLERKKSDEFSLKQTIDQNINEKRISGITYTIPEGAVLYEDRLRQLDARMIPAGEMQVPEVQGDD
jgi:hypothetical protein